MAKRVYNSDSDSGNDRPSKLPRGEGLVPPNVAMIEQIRRPMQNIEDAQLTIARLRRSMDIRELFGSDDEDDGVEDNDEDDEDDEEDDQEPWFVDNFSDYDADEESSDDDDDSVIDLTYQSK
ncbi:hypothetical protein PF005_g1120 [Phytophthora fragariae]|uniref:Uncharacterized protein n=2 Tax=Phytophthora fragariae TaxID=53985 RepID=A0A6A3ZJ24_9STRA|nr:hypothetical protein PF003_g29150 [Phytophthora fragariae]KAE8949195.1 hypothetical protein PF009_g1227 [Phytophthora fragariae]KAE8994273.1 hypothetical protein PF011_g16787 [Phytophthora fragariae]KAE9130340.1 hypothetical protein PF006_g15785 [Phytophthora fragariae]KAE9139087.1 hypothetical protein PF007_g1130 [Phytophthora fragariae]